jgi:ankyrin repeat protein
LLLAAGADPNVVDNDGDNALGLATRFEHEEIVTLLNERIA